MPQMFRTNSEGRGRILQPHGVLRLWRGVLLAVHEGSFRLTLLEVSFQLLMDDITTVSGVSV